MSKQVQSQTVKLRIYKKIQGVRGVVKDEVTGQIANPNQIVSLPYGSFEYRNYMNQINPYEYAKVEVEKFLVNGEQAEAPSELLEDVKKPFAVQKPIEEKSNPINEEIALLKEQNRLLMEQLKAQATERTMKTTRELLDQIEPTQDDQKEETGEALKPTPEDAKTGQSREELAEKYKATFGRSPHKNWDAEAIADKLKNA